MKNQDQIVQDAMRQLIKKSCSHSFNSESNYYSFQKSLLKFFFEAADVSISYDTNTILLWTSKKTDVHPGRLYDINEAYSISISYTNLEETLKGCIEPNEKNNRFYKSLLFHYNNVEQEIPSTAISA
jgi:hypothetical protein